MLSKVEVLKALPPFRFKMRSIQTSIGVFIKAQTNPLTSRERLYQREKPRLTSRPSNKTCPCLTHCLTRVSTSGTLPQLPLGRFPLSNLPTIFSISIARRPKSEKVVSNSPLLPGHLFSNFKIAALKTNLSQPPHSLL